jgi:hypothetical protein
VPALVVLVGALALVGQPQQASSSADGVAAATCRGPAALENYLALGAGRRIFLKRERCAVGQAVVKRFAARCQKAYSWQGTCRVRATRRWRCASRLVGTALDGAPASVRCSARRSRVRFTVKLNMDSLAPPPVISTAAPGPPWLNDRNCVDGAAAGDAAPLLGAPNDTFVIRTSGSIPVVVAEAVQAELVEHSVVPRLVNGLGSRPPQYPTRLPVFLRKGIAEGITGRLCDGSGTGAVVVIGETVESSAKTTAHELFHGHASGITPPRSVYAWFDDLGAEWSAWRSGVRFIPHWEVLLQYPDHAADTTEPQGYRYALWRLIQFLDDKGMIHQGNTWPLISHVVKSSNQTAGFDQFLRSKQTSLGEELAAFWGEHLKPKPRRPPQLVPVAANSQTVTINPGQQPYEVEAGALHTKLTEFKIADNVKRVEFEFKPPTNGYFWGLVSADESQRFNLDQTVAFCANGTGTDELEWPGSFPVTFTNGFLSSTAISGRILIYAQAKASQCKGPPAPACGVLNEAGARSQLGPDLPRIGGFSGHRGTRAGRAYSSCAYRGIQGLATIDITRWSSSRALRAWIKRKSHSPGWRPVSLGDAGTVFERPGHAFVQVAVGRKRLTISVHGGGATATAVQLAADAIPQIR